MKTYIIIGVIIAIIDTLCQLHTRYGKDDVAAYSRDFEVKMFDGKVVSWKEFLLWKIVTALLWPLALVALVIVLLWIHKNYN